MLEENGYLGYVDGLEDMKLFAPELVSERTTLNTYVSVDSCKT